MNQFDTTGRRLPLPKARYEAPEPWKDADRKQLLQFLKTPSGTKFLLTLHDVAAGRAFSVAERTPHEYESTKDLSLSYRIYQTVVRPDSAGAHVGHDRMQDAQAASYTLHGRQPGRNRAS